MKTRSSKRLSQIPVIEEESEDNGGDICGKRQRLGKRFAAKMSKSLNSEPVVENKEEVKNGTNYDSDSSGSSSNEFLQPPDTLDLDSDFFKVKKEEPASDFSAIEKAIFSDVKRLSDSENSDCEEPYSFKDNFKVISSVKTEIPVVHPTKEDPGNVKSSENEKKVVKKEIIRKGKMKLKTIHEKNNVNQNSARQTRQKLPNKGHVKKEISDIDKMDVAQLLAHGETQGKGSTETSVSHLFESDDDDVSDWEEVRGAETLGGKEHSIPEKGVEVTLKIPDLLNKRRKKRFDMEAHLKRKLNRRKRELQVLVHKVHLLCWIAHGRYVNSVLNSQDLMGVCLSVIPSQHCYPPDRVNLSYLEQIATWFNKTISPGKLKEQLPLELSLQKQLAAKVANSEREFVFLFICLLRSLGLSARLVISLQPLPLKPPTDELCTFSSKKPTKSSKKGKESPKKSPKQKLGKSDCIPSNDAVSNRKRGVMCREEAVERLKEFKSTGGGEEHPSNKSSKTTSMPSTKSKSATTPKESKANRSLRPRREVTVKYNDSENSDEDSSLPVSVDTSIAHEKEFCIKTSGKNDKKHAVQNSMKSNSTSKDKTETKETSEPRSVSKKSANIGGKDKSVKLKNGHKSSKLPSENIAKNNSKHMDSKSASCDRSVDNSSDDFTPVASCSYPQKKVKNSSVTEKKVKVQENGDSDFEPEEQKVRKRTSGPSSKKVDRKVLSSDTDEGEGDKKISRKQGCDVWAEVYLEAEEKWISVDVPRGKVHCVQELYARATKPVAYVVAWNADLTLKDVTRRYCAQFHTATRKQRVDQDWWDKALKPFVVRRPTARDREEEEDLDRQLQDRPLPKTLAEYKNHPLYVLPQHLLKFEAIYPPDAPPLGFFRKEPVYARECVYTLHSREVWVKEAKVVRPGEKPYKIVKARPKYDRMTGKVLSDLPLEVFGHWQVEDYVPPEAVDGKVPRNPYGNVELFKPCMLPKGTVHMQLPGLNRVARKLQIDCAPAMIGFDYHSGGSHPVYDGYVVCEEFREVLADAWAKEQAEAIRREQERIEKRVYGNWRRLIKGLMIRERLKARYSFEEPSGSQKKRSKKVKVSSKRRKVESDDDSEWETIE